MASIPAFESTKLFSPLEPLRLSVLYYKRTNKVHKNRGTTKEDGTLTISPPPSCIVTLSSSAPVLECDDSEEEHVTKKHKWKNNGKGTESRARRSTSGMIFSGVNKDISRRAFPAPTEGGLKEDDVLILNGQWQCEISSILNITGKCPDGAGNSSDSNVGASVAVPMRTMTAPSSVLISSKIRAPLVSLHKNNMVMKKQHKMVKTISSGLTKRTTGQLGQVSARSASAKLKEDTNGEWHLHVENDPSSKEDEDCCTKTTLPTMNVNKIPTSLLNKASTKRARTVVTGGFRNPKVKTETKWDDINFPGALGDIINVPASIRDALRPHQSEGIAFLWNCVTGVNVGLNKVFDENNNGMDDEANISSTSNEAIPKGAVLADEMGLGKTLMTIAIIYALHRRQRDRRFVVVCPSSLVSNWAKEFDQWLGKASQPKRVLVRSGAEEGLRNLRSFVPLKPQQAEVLILSYDLFRLNVKIVSKATRIGLLVVDEGHRLKNTSGSQTLSALNSIHAEARILITGTPIQNNLSEFYNLADFCLPGVLGDLNTFRRIYEHPMSTANQKNASREQKERGRDQSKALDAITSTFVLRRLQKDVLKSILPPRKEILLFCRPSGRQCELYEDISRRASKSVESAWGNVESDNPLTLLTELRKICTHPALVDKCSTSNDTDASLSGKMVVLESLIDSVRQHNPTDKLVIISNFTMALTVIENCILRKKKLSFVRLDGSVELSARQPIVDSFNKGSVNHSFAFLLSSKAGGCGLNLIGANRLIMVDAEWNPATDHQAMARVYRPGQTKPCYIYRMFTTGTVEEVIYQRQIQKGDLARMANCGGSRTNANFSKDELRDCFKLKQGCKCDTKDKLGSKWVDYTGIGSLQGCTDNPLLNVCEDRADTLSYVRIVIDDQSSRNFSSDESKSFDIFSDCSSSEEEEFE